jgi:hypothetical protein
MNKTRLINKYILLWVWLYLFIVIVCVFLYIAYIVIKKKTKTKLCEKSLMFLGMVNIIYNIYVIRFIYDL